MPFRWTSQVIIANVGHRADSGGVGLDFKALLTPKQEFLRSRPKTQTVASRSGREITLSGDAEHDTLHWFLPSGIASLLSKASETISKGQRTHSCRFIFS
jgi:hypothetical protein